MYDGAMVECEGARSGIGLGWAAAAGRVADAFMEIVRRKNDLQVWVDEIGEDSVVEVEVEGEEEGLRFSRRWRPTRVRRPTDYVEGLIPREMWGDVPAEWRGLLTNYAWYEFEHGDVTLLANDGGRRYRVKDTFMWEFLMGRSFLQVGRGGQQFYNPVCIDLAGGDGRRKNSVVEFDHEEILMREELRVVDVPFASIGDFLRDSPRD